MSPDLRSIVPALVATLAAACSSTSSSRDDFRCQSQPPRETRQELPMNESFCAVPTQAPEPAPSAAAPEAAGPQVAASDAAPSASEEAPPPPPPPSPPPPVKAAENIVPSDPKTCELDCYRFCSGVCRRLSEEKVECVQFEGGHACGRMIEGAHGPAGAGALQAMFSLESISAIAFERLAMELRNLGAPHALVCGAEDNAADERRHAALVRSMLEAKGLPFQEPTATLRDDRTLLEIASENAVEGCVRETFGALGAEYGRVRGGALSAFYEEIAEDELRHAAWSWDLHAWAKSALGPDRAAELDELTRRAFEELMDPEKTPSLPGIDPSFASVQIAAIGALADRLGVAA